MLQFETSEDFTHLALERREGKEQEREKNFDMREIHQSVASRAPTGDQTRNPGLGE